MAPPLTVISPEAKLEVASLEVNTRVIELSFVVSPLLISSTVLIVIVGAVESYVQLN